MRAERTSSSSCAWRRRLATTTISSIGSSTTPPKSRCANFRLDLDVDGPGNSINRDVYRRVRLPADSARRSLYVVEHEIPETEAAATLDTHGGPVRLRVINEQRTNGVGN